MNLYLISGSPFAWRAQLALEFKGISYKPIFLNAGESEHKGEDYLKINPRGLVPALRDGEVVVYEALAILAYLEMRQPEPRLFGAKPAKTGRIWQRVQEIENYVRNPLAGVAVDILFGRAEQKHDEIQQLVVVCREQLNWIEGLLSKTPYMAGASISAADFMFYPFLMIFKRAIAKEPGFGLAADDFTKLWPATANWAAQIENLPYYSKTCPPHWKGSSTQKGGIL